MKVVSDSLEPHGLYSEWNSPGQNTGVGSRSLLQWIFPTQGSNPGLQHCRWILYQLSHKGSPRIVEWVAYPFCRGSSQPRNQARVCGIAGGFFTSWVLAGKPKVVNQLHFNKINIDFKKVLSDFPGGSVVNTVPSSAGEGWIPGWGANISHTCGQET